MEHNARCVLKPGSANEGAFLNLSAAAAFSALILDDCTSDVRVRERVVDLDVLVDALWITL